MRVPDGRECPYYDGGYYRRAAAKERCHLLDGKPDARHWASVLCRHCRAPDIHRANGCATMILHARVGGVGWRFWEIRRMHIWATCTRSGAVVEDPFRGCGLCHSSLTFVVGPEPEGSP